jgi:23S rRNA (adenine-N6)-dimethyltransferase
VRLSSRARHGGGPKPRISSSILDGCLPASWSFVPVAHRSRRDDRRRELGQNFLRDKQLAADLASRSKPGELIVEFGAGRGALTIPLASVGARVIAIERDEVWAAQLRDRLSRGRLAHRVRVMTADALQVGLPAEPFRVIASPPFNQTTKLLRELLDDPLRGPTSIDMLLQWEVAQKRSTLPPTTLLSTTWAPWWRFTLVRRVPRSAFRPVPRVDAAWLSVVKRSRPLLPPEMAREYAAFVRANWKRAN